MRTFRARLTLWNVGVLGLVLVVFALALMLSNQSRAATEIDRELIQRSRPGQGPGPRPLGGSGQNMGGAPPGPDGNGPQDNGPQNGPPPRPRREDFNGDDEGFRIANTRRPRHFDDQGNPNGREGDVAFDRAAVLRATNGWAGFTDGEFESVPIRIFTHPDRNGEDIVGVIQVAQEKTDLDRLWRSQLTTLFIFIPIALIVAAGGALFLTGRAIRPIAKMREAAASITEADLSKRLAIEGEDEFAELGRTFNAMTGRLDVAFSDLKKAYRELEESSENQRRFTADASHELRTPLTRLRLATDVALSPDASEADRTKAVKTADEVARSMTRLVQELLILARSDAGQMNLRRESIDLRLVASNAVSALPGAASDRITTEFSPDAVRMRGDEEALGRVCMNLLENALRHTPADGRIICRVAEANGMALLEVTDTGEGIAADHISRLTERFYRVDASRTAGDGGTGLGLAICAAIVDAHRGRMKIESKVGRGTTISVLLPTKEEFQTESS